MPARIGPGPVFVYESLILSRRRQVYAGRMLFVLVIFLGLAAAWWRMDVRSAAGTAPAMLSALAEAGRQFFYNLAGLQLALVLLAAPAATAGAICQDRARGILDQLAVTDLSNAEIVLGKLGSRLAPILGMLACALPVAALATLLGGIDPQALMNLFAVSAALVVLGCSLALAISLTAARTHEVIIAVLALWVLWLLSLPIWLGASTISGVVPPPDWYRKANPFVLVYGPYAWPGYVTPADVALFVAGALLFSAALVARTIAMVRRHAPGPARRVRRRSSLDRLGLARWPAWLPGPSLDGNPVLWREWHRNRPTRLMRIIWLIYVISSVAGVGIGIHEAVFYGMGRAAGSFTLVIAVHLQFLFGLMILSVQAPTSLAEERLRGSLDVLLTTPLSTRTILWGKWLGSYRVAFGLAIFPAVGSAIVAGLTPAFPARFTSTFGVVPTGLLDRIVTPLLVVAELLALGAAITAMGLALATWTPRLGRAIGINVVLFVLIAVGWPLLVQSVLWPPLRDWLIASGEPEPRWLLDGLFAISPFTAPIVTLEWLIDRAGDLRWKFWLVALAWCALACAFAAAVFWATLRTFDRCLGRMPETGACGDEIYVGPFGASRSDGSGSGGWGGGRISRSGQRNPAMTSSPESSSSSSTNRIEPSAR